MSRIQLKLKIFVINVYELSYSCPEILEAVLLVQLETLVQVKQIHSGDFIVLMQLHRILCSCSEYTYRPRIRIMESIPSFRITFTMVLISRIHNIDI